ncbi:bacillithiol system redox-active protein YtxJ [Paenibacillus sp. FSL R5-0407]|uniref:bacillithiol system redox-active protein YtxJ n=1 Tax=Paenibacillus sp. FSL R5-0407 TaxID=2975320 RepID=UPI0030FCD440
MSELKRITTTEDLQKAFEQSADQPLLLFKHSTRCPISAGAHRELADYLNDAPNEKITYGLIYVVEDREVSNAAAEKLGVKHESPQALLVKDGQAVWHASHSKITADAIRGILAK